MQLKFNLIVKCKVIAIGLIVLSGCAMVDQTTKETDSGGVDTSFNGTWIVKVTEYRREQLAPGLGNTRIRWTCGDGKPFQLELNVKDGSVHIMNGKPVKIGKVSRNSQFKSIYSRGAESIDIYTGSFDKKVGKIQNRRNGINGCYYGFKLDKKWTLGL